MANPSTLAFYLGLGLVASILLAGGLLMMKSHSAALPPAHGIGMLGAVLKWIRDPVWSGGLGIQAIGYALYLVALADAPVSLVAVMMQGGIGLFVVFAVMFLHEEANPREWAGIGGIVAAMVILALSLQGGAVQGKANAPVLYALAAIAIIVAVVPSSSTRLRQSGAASAIASGIAFGLGSVFTKALAEAFLAQAGTALMLRVFADSWLYFASAANIAGLILLQNSFHSARGIIAMPLSSACSNVVPIIGGMAAFGEALPADPLAASLRIGAFALTIASSALLATGTQQPAT
jgi:multidrug transporter EmrE-like cation transporter